jgi:hypothetical protein
MKIENKANNSCPYCGSEAKTGMIANSFWLCGNATTDENRRSELCREREAHNQTKRERDDARDVLEEISLYLSSGIGDENTTAQQYKERILDGIKHLAGHAWEERCKFERERDDAREKYTTLLTENMFAVHNLHEKLDNAVAVADELAEIASLCLGQTLSNIKSNTDENNLKQADKITRALEQWKKLKKEKL